MTIDERALDLGFQEYDRATANGDDELAAFRKGIEAYEAVCWRSIDENCQKQMDMKTLNVTDKRLIAIFDVNRYHIKQMNKFKNRVDAAKKRLGDLKAKHTEWYRKHPMDCTEKNNVDLINDMESIAYSVDCYLDGVSGPYLDKE